MRRLRFASIAVLLLGSIFFTPHVSASTSQRQWFQDAKFGMFIHWGPYSVAGVEPSWPIMQQGGPISYEKYVALPSRFTPVDFDAREWVRLAKAAGQKYIVFTTKHHDGFAMFDADNMSDYKITKTPFGRDVLAELADAAREEGMPLGIYYSPPDLHHPGYRDMTLPAYEHPYGQSDRPEWASYLDYMEAHLRQLLTRYGDIAIVWFDGLMDKHPQNYQGERFHKIVHELQPKALINDRIGLPGDFATPEGRIPDSSQEFSGMWEACMTMNESWGYNRDDHNYKSALDLISKLVDATSKNGNLLLNVGPTPLGVIQPEFRERLLQMGAWLRRNGEAIYGAKAGPIQGRADVRTTAKGRRIYIHLLRVPKNRQVVLPWRSHSLIKRASVLASNKNVRLRHTRDGIEIVVPRDVVSLPVPVIVFDM